MAERTTTRPTPVPQAKLWFGFTGTAAAWIVLSSVDVLIAWWACVPDRILGDGTVRPGVGFLYFIAALTLIGTAVIAGVISYRNWRQLSEAPSLSDAQAERRPEFMALMGLFVSLTLGVGLIWLTIPLFILNFCVRAR